MRILAIVSILTLLGCGRHDGETASTCSQKFPADDGRPAVLIIGDSISIGYTPFVSAALPQFQVFHNLCNAETSSWDLAHVDAWLDSRISFEAITFNNGIWDDRANTPIDVYKSNLSQIAEKILAKTSRPFFVLTTEVLPGTPLQNNSDIEAMNQAAIEVMANYSIPVIDLYTVSQGLRDQHLGAYNVHYTPAGYQALSEPVISALSP